MGKKKTALSAAYKWSNPERARAMRELGRSNAASPHVPAPRKGTRKVQARRAIADQLS